MKYAHDVEPGQRVKLAKISTKPPHELTREQGEALFAQLSEELGKLQEELYAAAQHSVLIVLQGMDTSGKDGAIRKVFDAVNPQGCRVESFKVPSEEEQSHDFLWRAHKVAPRKGMIAVFNRSHYEDVLVVRVHKLVGKKAWQQRYEQINAFEHMLAANDTIVIKCFLHISKEEQEQRLLAREQDVEKAWKLSAGDWKEREYWDDYTEAYQDALESCSTKQAPWYIIPADDKWYRNLAIAEILVRTLKGYRADWKKSLQRMSKARLAELEAYRSQQAEPQP